MEETSEIEERAGGASPSHHTLHRTGSVLEFGVPEQTHPNPQVPTTVTPLGSGQRC